MSFPEAGISVSLSIHDGRIASVDIASTRLVQASRLLAGKTPEAITALLPTLFSLCGTAQGLASAAAFEQALGLPIHPAQRMARRYLLLCETLAEHAQGVFRDWPGLLGEAPDLVALKSLLPLAASARRALYPDGDWTRPGGGRLAPDRDALAALARQASDSAARLLGGEDEGWETDPQDFRDWTRRGGSIAARLLARIEEDGLAGFGAALPHFMPEGGPRDLAARLAADADGAYVARPDCGGIVFETTPASRRRAEPLIKALADEGGFGLLARLAARLVEIALTLREIDDLAHDLCPDPACLAPLGGDGAGLGVVEAARGLLVHRVEMENGMARRYQILAPTEWNFHPLGALAAGLRGAPAGSDPVWRARALALALDPCVACEVRLA